MKFHQHSGIYSLRSKIHLPISLDEAWSFFSNPGNLAKITPESMGFTITSPVQSKCYPGQIISYKISPFPGIKSNWVTEITHVQEPYFFVDEQRFGPYKMWHHEHHFKESKNGVEMLDIVSYKLPAGLFGKLFHPIVVKPKLKAIFEHRSTILHKMFSS